MGDMDIDRIFLQALEIKSKSLKDHPGRKAWNAAPEFLRMTLLENSEVRAVRSMGFKNRIALCDSLLEQAERLQAEGELDRAVSRFTNAVSVFLWFERVPDAEDLPLRSATARLAPKHRATAELALSAAMVGAGHCLLALGDPDGAVYAAATAVRLLSRVEAEAEPSEPSDAAARRPRTGSDAGVEALRRERSEGAGPVDVRALLARVSRSGVGKSRDPADLRSRALLLRAQGNLARATARGLLRAREDLRWLARGGRDVGGTPLASIELALEGVEEEVRSLRDDEAAAARRGLRQAPSLLSRGAEPVPAGPAPGLAAHAEGSDEGADEGADGDGDGAAGGQAAPAHGPPDGVSIEGATSSALGPRTPPPSKSASRAAMSRDVSKTWQAGRGEGARRQSSASGSGGEGDPGTPGAASRKLGRSESDSTPRPHRKSSSGRLDPVRVRPAGRVGGFTLRGVRGDVLRVAKEMDLDLQDPLVLAELDKLSRAEQERRRKAGETSGSEAEGGGKGQEDAAAPGGKRRARVTARQTQRRLERERGGAKVTLPFLGPVPVGDVAAWAFRAASLALSVYFGRRIYAAVVGGEPVAAALAGDVAGTVLGPDLADLSGALGHHVPL